MHFLLSWVTYLWPRSSSSSRSTARYTSNAAVYQMLGLKWWEQLGPCRSAVWLK